MLNQIEVKNFSQLVGFFRDNGGHPNSAVILGSQLNHCTYFSGKQIADASRQSANLISMLKKAKLTEIKTTQLDKILTALPWEMRIAFFGEWLSQLDKFDQVVKKDPSLLESFLGSQPPEIGG